MSLYRDMRRKDRAGRAARIPEDLEGAVLCCTGRDGPVAVLCSTGIGLFDELIEHVLFPLAKEILCIATFAQTEPDELRTRFEECSEDL